MFLVFEWFVCTNIANNYPETVGASFTERWTWVTYFAVTHRSHPSHTCIKKLHAASYGAQAPKWRIDDGR
jgi:hypothetical protein